jgi:hypothetical protein
LVWCIYRAAFPVSSLPTTRITNGADTITFRKA